MTVLSIRFGPRLRNQPDLSTPGYSRWLKLKSGLGIWFLIILEKGATLTAMKRTLLVALLGLFSLSSASAGLTAFLKIPDIPGESQAVEHEDEIDIHDMSWSVSRPVVEGRTTEVDLSDLKVVKELDKSSPKLMEACATGKAIDEIVLYARKDSGDAHLDYLKITLTNVYVTSYEMLSTSGDADDRPTEEVAFYYNKISFEYVRGDETGGAGEMVEGIYDRKTGTTQ